MARTEFVFLKGKLKWCRVHQPNKFGKWATDIYLSGDDLEKVRELQSQGMKNVLKKDEDGYYTTFSRPTSKELRGKIIGYAPPEVLDGSQILPDGSNPPLRDVLIGNGTDATIKLEVYEHRVPGTDKKAKAARLLSIRVDNLVPFTVKRDFDEDQERAIKGLQEQPQPIF